MVDTTARLLGLLAALQSSPRIWSGPELAERFGVTARTVRRDVDRLRQLGYPVLTHAGATGGYQLGTGGAAIPPLMLERDEAVAIAAALRAVPGVAAGSSALAKLEQFLPPTARREMSAVGDMTLGLDGRPPVDPAMLVTLTTACRDGERLRLDYVSRDGAPSERLVVPLRLVHAVGRWYVVAYDRGRSEWRTFRLDRIDSIVATGHRETPPDPPDPHRFVQAALSINPYRYQARVLFAAPLGVMAERIPAEAAVLTAVDDDSTLVSTGGDSLDVILWHLLRVGIDFEVIGPAVLVDHMAELSRRLTALTGANRVGRRQAVTP
ncbi:helix-turn-helix transcriptional regulator [Desertimonas flava]|uniref:helix-turn-helix transcriptional regulator n=1 Tax=Desertimonas flava TaxID=2064846 RepID=UPI000E349F59|nr:WYL domain-containing protein [Desertimonas flava]